MATNKEIMENEVNNLPTKEEVLMNEDELLLGLLSAAQEIEETTKTIRIERNGKLHFQFKIRPISDEEIQKCMKACTKYYKNPAGKNLPKIEGETDWVAYKAKKIYAATVDSDKAKLWDNPKIKDALMQKLGIDTLLPEDVINASLLPGEKNRISEIIDELSGYSNEEVTEEEYAKN